MLSTDIEEEAGRCAFTEIQVASQLIYHKMEGGAEVGIMNPKVFFLVHQIYHNSLLVRERQQSRASTLPAQPTLFRSSKRHI